MPDPGPSLGVRPAVLAASFALLAGACAGVDEGRTDAEVEQLRLGRVHVVVDAGQDDVAGDLDVSARFAYVRGLDEDFVRARIEMPVLAHDILQAPDCVASDQLSATEGEAEGGELQELVLVDAGDLRVDIGDQRYEVPLSLVPDLLPYMSGVEYVMVSDAPPSLDGLTMEVHASGSQSDELPAFATESNVPAALDLSVNAYTDRGRPGVVVGWQAGEAEATVTLRITALLGDDVTGSEITCLVADSGRAPLSLGSLQALGLAANAEGLRVEASRLVTSTFDAGDFAGSELVIERRETAELR